MLCNSSQHIIECDHESDIEIESISSNFDELNLQGNTSYLINQADLIY